MPSLRTVICVSLIGMWPLWDLAAYLFASEPQRPITEERKAELLEKGDPLFRKVMTAPPYCWGYKGPRRVWPEQGQWTDAAAKDFMASHAERQKLWLDSIGQSPPLTCEEYLRH